MKFFPKISIVIPSLNKARFIEETLDSIFSQDYPNVEVIIQDGGSTDGTLKIIKKYASKYPKIISWESNQDNGQTDAINKGLKKASGNILAYINADDIYKKDALKKVGEYFKRHPETVWLTGKGNIIDEKGRKFSSWVSTYKNLLLGVNQYFLLLTVNYLFQPSVFLSKKAYEKYGPFIGTKKIVMEYDLWLKLGRITMPKVLPRYLSSFRLSKGSFSTSEFHSVLLADEKIAEKYTVNPLILFLHRLHNLARILTLKVSK